MDFKVATSLWHPHTGGIDKLLSFKTSCFANH